MSNLLSLLFEIFWLILPAGCANMAPLFARKIFPAWTTPIDGGRSLGGIRILGDHKTVRGLVAGTLVGALIFFAQQALWQRYALLHAFSRFDYQTAPWWFGAVMGFGALTGDSLKSFFKRRVGRKPGQPWYPFDQIDWLLGALLVSWPIAHPDVVFVCVAILAFMIVSPAVKIIGYFLRVDDQPI
jgi:CDP-2,3-bis-(O-geranylgeranyl)-sn-glycerol synthase